MNNFLLPLKLAVGCLVVLVPQLLLQACAEGCTLAGCNDYALLAFPADIPQAGEWNFIIHLDGRDVNCSLTLPHTGETTDGSCDQPGVGVEYRWTGERNVYVAEGIYLRETPKTVVVTVQQPNSATFTQAAELRYHSVTPNGPECEPTCQSGAATLALQP